jgi:hypothetical protein
MKWWLVCLAALLLSVITFTPLVIPEGQFSPMLFGLPVTLWTGILVAFAFVVLTFVAARVHPEALDDVGGPE